MHFISAHFSLFNKFADKRADSAKQHAQNERLKTQTCPLDPNNSDNNAYRTPKFCAAFPPQFQFAQRVRHTQSENGIEQTPETIAMRYGYNRRCLSVQMAKSMGRKIKRKVKPKKKKK